MNYITIFVMRALLNWWWDFAFFLFFLIFKITTVLLQIIYIWVELSSFWLVIYNWSRLYHYHIVVVVYFRWVFGILNTLELLIKSIWTSESTPSVKLDLVVHFNSLSSTLNPFWKNFKSPAFTTVTRWNDTLSRTLLLNLCRFFQ